MDMQGMPALRQLIIPPVPAGQTLDCSTLVPTVVNGLTKPLTDEEKKTGTMPQKKLPRIALTGSLAEVEDYFYAQKWTDGLPIVPPTESLVKEFLKHTKHSPTEVVTTSVWPEQYTATVEKVAIVGAMAGCKPEYMPVLLAVVEAFGRDVFASAARSTQSFSFPTFVNGPIRNEIHMNGSGSSSAMGPCNQANATIGRFLRLAIVALGGSWPGENEMSVQGNPSKYSFCFAENEEDSPWEPFSVSAGFKKGESTVTMANGGWCHFGNSSDLDTLAKAIVSFQWRNGVLIIMDPSAAKNLAAKGMAKAAVEQYVWERAVTPMSEFKRNWYSLIEGTWQGVPMYGELGIWPDYRKLPDDAIVQAYPRKYVKVVVCGSGGMAVAQAWKASYYQTVSVDKWR
jgi:hypothetical protein